ncbi:uncharacterized protein TM35_000092180 [Trypanosoma theileri]|uniref:Uncharacterized protein n=1 Tax=Trypanosoma theileri TaxID=67003 RepID=A0A1X0P045_9TRYP|nr:uncharacterized protein TM35_000092180 [Trypanosoma theileri]ORC90168.1 hypothetical protein TM35_000092180 [Trypanosoma theileri]
MKATEDTAVKFDPKPLQVPQSRIYAAGADDVSAVPTNRTSRRIDFTDDGKLFEGHFTLHTRSLKNMIQLLVDQQSEQRVIINDLQDQVNTLRQQATKMKKVSRLSPAHSSRDGSDDVGVIMKELEDLRHRVKVLDGFRALWGIRSEEIESLVSTYGDPVVTPEEYTACILNLQAFRVMRNDTRNSVISLVDSRTSAQGRPISPERGGKTRPTRDRTVRETSRGARDDDSRAPHDDGIPADRDEPRGAREVSRESRGARATREESRAERDESRGARADRDESRAEREESRGARATREESRADRDEHHRGARADREEYHRGARAGRDDSRGARAGRDESRGTRDRQARGDDSRDVREEDPRESHEGTTHGAESTGETLGQLASRVDALERKIRRNSSAGYFAPRQASASPTEMVDEQARQDLEELERFVVRRFKELDRMLAKPRDSSHSGAQRSSSHSPGRTERSHERAPPASSENTRSSNANIKNTSGNTEVSKNNDSISELKPRKDRKSAPTTGGAMVDQMARDDAATALDRLDSLERFVTRKIKDLSVAIGKDLGPVSIRPSGETEVPAPVERRPQGSMVDQMARDDAARSLEMIQELEEDLGKRWQSLEERLRIIGRVTMGRGSVGPSATASSIDRKAREDASMSLMRIQQLEREIVGFRRLLQKHRLLDTEEVEISDTRGTGGGAFPISPARLLRQTALLSPVVTTDRTGAPADADHDARMQILEQEVEQRMSEVNRALATLRSAQGDSGQGNMSGLNSVVNNGSPLMAGQVVFNSSDTEASRFQGIGIPYSSSTTLEGGVLIVTSRESPSRTPVKVIEGAQPDMFQLRPPQLGALGAPLVTRDMQQGGMSATPPNVLSFTTGTMKSESPMDNRVQNSVSAAEVAMPTTGGTSGENVLSASRELSSNSLTADASKNVPAVAASSLESQTLRNIKLSMGEDGQAIRRDRNGELNQLRSHGTRLRGISLSSRGRTENGFSTEPSALGHTTPCVVYNCAWCAAQKRTISARSPRSLR